MKNNIDKFSNLTKREKLGSVNLLKFIYFHGS